MSWSSSPAPAVPPTLAKVPIVLVTSVVKHINAGGVCRSSCDWSQLLLDAQTKVRLTSRRMAGNGASALLGMADIVKRFPGVVALDGVDLDVRAGRGALPARPERRRQVDPDQGARRRAPARRGRDHLGGRGGARSATRRPPCDLGIATIYQELDLVDGLTRRREHLPRPRAVARSASRSAARDREVGRAHCSSGSATPRSRPTARSARSRAAGKQIVSMARALSHDARLHRHGRAVGRARPAARSTTCSGSSAT